MKRLAIISHTPHYRVGNKIVGLAATVREISHLARLFDSVRHVAPLHSGPPPGNCVEYETPSVELRPVPPAGGESLADKLSILRSYPAYAKAIADEIRGADVVHVRCPANIALLALAELKIVPTRARVWVKYAGAWNGYPGEPFSYRLQRKWLTAMPGHAVVTVNGTWPGQPEHVRSFYNPCLTMSEIAAAESAAKEQGELQTATLLFVGRLDSDKGFPVFLDAVRQLRDLGHVVRAEVAGDGPDRAKFEEQTRRDGTAALVSFHGWRTREQLNEYYQRAHFIVLPSRAEGWPKVLSEAMAFGAVPVASRVGSIGQYLPEFGCGRSIEGPDARAYAQAIAGYLANPESWRAESAKARAAARRFTYDAYLDGVRELLTPAGSLCFIGYMAGARPGHTTSQGYVLSELMRSANWNVARVSDWHNRYARLADVAAHVGIRRFRRGTVAVIEVYSGANFVLVDTASALAKWRGLPIVMVLHGGGLPAMFRSRPQWTGRVLRRAWRIVAPSEFLARAANEIHGLEAEVIPNLVPVERYRFRPRRTIRPRLFWMRGFHEVYNPAMALRVLGRLLQTHADASLIMAGRPDADCDRIRKLAAELGLADAVSFPGFLDQQGKDRAAEESDVFINTNRIDNMPVAVVEACAYGMPVVATAAGGIPDLLTHGKNGLLVDGEDDAAMAEAIRRLMDDPELAEKLSTEGRALAMRSARETVVPRWESLFRQAAGVVGR